MNAVAVNILYINHTLILFTPLPHREGLGVGLLLLHLVPMLIIVIIAYLHILENGDGVVGEGG